MTVTESENTFTISGDFDQSSMKYLRAGIFRKISNDNFSIVHLDFSDCTEAHQSEMLPFISQIRQHQVNNKKFEIVFPKNEYLSRLFSNANWAGMIDSQFTLHSSSDLKKLPASNYTSEEDLHPIIDHACRVVLNQMSDFSQDALHVVEWAISEIADNVIRHAYFSKPKGMKELGGFIQVSTYPTINAVEVVVADAGVTIPVSLDITTDPEEALRMAVSEGKTRDSKIGAGNGLYGSLQLALNSGGQFDIWSGFAHLGLKDGKVSTNKEIIPFVGTAVRCRINCSSPKLLEDALKIGGKSYIPASGYFDRQTSGKDDESGEIKVREERHAIRTRQGGEAIRNRILLLLESKKSVFVDFSDVGIISASFADEVFGKLFNDIGPIGFNHAIRIINTTPVVGGLIDRAIRQRAALTLAAE